MTDRQQPAPVPQGPCAAGMAIEQRRKRDPQLSLFDPAPVEVDVDAD